MPNKRNWKRSYEVEDNDRTVKYAWHHVKFEDYLIIVTDTKKELGRYHEDYSEEERYAVDFEKDGDLIESMYERTVNAAYNLATDLQEDYPDAREMHLELGPENDTPEDYPASKHVS